MNPPGVESAAAVALSLEFVAPSAAAVALSFQSVAPSAATVGSVAEVGVLCLAAFDEKFKDFRDYPRTVI